jgi:hypothetical protein
MVWRAQMFLQLLIQVCCQVVPLIQRPTNCIALSSTDSWMEMMIRKKHNNVRKLNVAPELAAVLVDPLEQLE